MSSGKKARFFVVSAAVLPPGGAGRLASVHGRHRYLNEPVSPSEARSMWHLNGGILFGNCAPIGREFVRDRDKKLTRGMRIGRLEERKTIRMMNRGKSQRARDAVHVLFARRATDGELCCFQVSASYCSRFTFSPKGSGESVSCTDEQFRSVVNAVAGCLSGTHSRDSLYRKRPRPSDRDQEEESGLDWKEFKFNEKGGGLPSRMFGPHHISQNEFSKSRPSACVNLCQKSGRVVARVSMFAARSAHNYSICIPTDMYAHAVQDVLIPELERTAEVMLNRRKGALRPVFDDIKRGDRPHEDVFYIQCHDGRVELNARVGELSTVIQKAIQTCQTATPKKETAFRVLSVGEIAGVSAATMQVIVDYAQHYVCEQPPDCSALLYGSDDAALELNTMEKEMGPYSPQCPIKANKGLAYTFMGLWDRKWIENPENKKRVYEIVLAAELLEMRSLRDVACAHIATRIVNETKESVERSVCPQRAPVFPRRDSAHTAASEVAPAIDSIRRRLWQYLPPCNRAPTLCIEVLTTSIDHWLRLKKCTLSVGCHESKPVAFAEWGENPTLTKSLSPWGISAGKWIEFSADELNAAIPKGRRVAQRNKVSLCDSEYCVASKQYVDGYPDIKVLPGVPPGKIICKRPTKIVYYDIEVSNTGNKFPHYLCLACQVITIAVTVSEPNGSRQNHTFTLRWLCEEKGDVAVAAKKSGRYVERSYFNGAFATRVYPFDTEIGLLYGFADFLRRIRPDAVMGWNSSGFDLPYLWSRTVFLSERISAKANAWAAFLTLFDDPALLDHEVVPEPEQKRVAAPVAASQSSAMDLVSESSDDDEQPEGPSGPTSGVLGSCPERLWKTGALFPDANTHVLITQKNPKALAFATSPNSRAKKGSKLRSDVLDILRVDPNKPFTCVCNAFEKQSLRVGYLEFVFYGWVIPAQENAGGRVARLPEERPSRAHRLRFKGGSTTLIHARLLHALFSRCCGWRECNMTSDWPSAGAGVVEQGGRLLDRLLRSLGPADPSTRSTRDWAITAGYRHTGYIPGQPLGWSVAAATGNVSIQGGTGPAFCDLFLYAQNKYRPKQVGGKYTLDNISKIFLSDDKDKTGSKMKIQVKGHEQKSTIEIMNLLFLMPDMVPTGDKTDILRYCVLDALLVCKLSVSDSFNFINQMLSKCVLYNMPSIGAAIQSRPFAAFQMMLISRGEQMGYVLDVFYPVIKLLLKLRGALVVAPEYAGISYPNLAVLDFTSMYPSIIILFMLCLSTRAECSALGPQKPKRPDAWGVAAIRYLQRIKKRLQAEAIKVAGISEEFKQRLLENVRICGLFENAINDARVGNKTMKETSARLLDIIKANPHRIVQFLTPLSETECKVTGEDISPDPVGYVTQSQGLFGSILSVLFYQRNATKAKIKWIKKTKDTSLPEVQNEIKELETRSLEQKLSMNSAYGLMTFYDQNIMATVTAEGRDQLKEFQKNCGEDREKSKKCEKGKKCEEKILVEFVGGDTDGGQITFKSDSPSSLAPCPRDAPAAKSRLLRMIPETFSPDNALRSLAWVHSDTKWGRDAQAELERLRRQADRRPPGCVQASGEEEPSACGALLSPPVEKFMKSIRAAARERARQKNDWVAKEAQKLARELNLKFRATYCPLNDKYVIDRLNDRPLPLQPGHPNVEVDHVALGARLVAPKRYVMYMLNKVKLSGLQCEKTTMCTFAKTLHKILFGHMIKEDEITAWEVACAYLRGLFGGKLPLDTLTFRCTYNPESDRSVKSPANTIAKRMLKDKGIHLKKERIQYAYAVIPGAQKSARAVVPMPDTVMDMMVVLQSIMSHRGDMSAMLTACEKGFTLHMGPPGCTEADAKILREMGAKTLPEQLPSAAMQAPPGTCWVDLTEESKWRGAIRYALVIRPLRSSRSPIEGIDDDLESEDSDCGESDRDNDPVNQGVGAPACALVVAELKGVWANNRLCAAYTWFNKGESRGRPLSDSAYTDRDRLKINLALEGRPDPVAQLSLEGMMIRLFVRAEDSAKQIAANRISYCELGEHAYLDPFKRTRLWTMPRDNQILRRLAQQRKRARVS